MTTMIATCSLEKKNIDVSLFAVKFAKVLISLWLL